MPHNLSANLLIAKNKIDSTYPWYVLIKITMPDTTVLKYVNNNEDVTFQSLTYTAFPFEIDAVEENSTGALPSVQLRICNINGIVQEYIEANDGGIGATVELIVVNAEYLTEDYAELTMDF